MERYNAEVEKFTCIKVMGKQALFHDMRIDRSTIPPELHYYEVRHDDEGGFSPVQICYGVMVNHYGSLITKEPLFEDGENYLDIDPKTDWDETECIGCISLKEFLELE